MIRREKTGLRAKRADEQRIAFEIDDRVLFLIRQSKPVPCDLHNKREPFPVPRVAEHLVFRVSQPRKIVFRVIFLHDIPPQLFPVHAFTPYLNSSYSRRSGFLCRNAILMKVIGRMAQNTSAAHSVLSFSKSGSART